MLKKTLEPIKIGQLPHTCEDLSTIASLSILVLPRRPTHQLPFLFHNSLELNLSKEVFSLKMAAISI
jgi:hypothetical protein